MPRLNVNDLWNNLIIYKKLRFFKTHNFETPQPQDDNLFIAPFTLATIRLPYDAPKALFCDHV